MDDRNQIEMLMLENVGWILKIRSLKVAPIIISMRG